jgi:uncharacterized membrane protein YbhN (UPF0104 family)
MVCIAVSEDHPRAESTADESRGEIEARSRSLRNGIISLAVFSALVAALVFAVPGLRAAGEWISDATIGWVLLGIALELLSCAGYVVLFDHVFDELAHRLSTRLSLAELATNSVVSVSGLAGLALGAWVLATKGMSAQRIARGTVVLFVLTSAVNVVLVILIGVPMWLGLLPGSRNTLLTLLPAALALVLIVAVLALAAWAKRASSKGRLSRGRVGHALKAVSDGVAESLQVIRAGDWRLIGAVGYCVFDILTLYACLRAFGKVHTPSFWVVSMAYLVGMLANSVPTPAGLIAVEGGLVGMLILFGVRPATLVLAAVVIYRAISLWIPALIGSAAFWSLRPEIGKPLAPPVPT